MEIDVSEIFYKTIVSQVQVEIDSFNVYSWIKTIDFHL